MVGTQLTPPDISQNIPDIPRGNIKGRMEGVASTVGDVHLDIGGEELTPGRAVSLARECWDASTAWINSGRRVRWTESLRAFQSLHPSGSKYLSADYKYRSRLYRPKTRAMVRKSEAQTAAAFFSNEDVVSITATDDDDPKQQASAEIIKQLLQYRLTKTIPWFLTVNGARQDAEVMGICVAKAYWKFKERYSHTMPRPVTDYSGQPQFDPDTGELMTEDEDVYDKIEDHPWVDLISPENIRFDPGADWRDPIATSPYIIEAIPTYIHDTWGKIERGEWLPVSKSSLFNATDLDDDITRRAREQGRIPGKDHDAWKPREYDICWVRANTVRFGGRDWFYITLGSAGELLTEPKPIEEVYLHGIRPYVCGFVVLESHKTYPSSKVELVRDLQTKANDIDNLRLDNVKLALQPRQFVSQGAGFDLQDVRSFMPGKTIVGKDPKNNVVWDRPPEVTQSSYAEQDRVNLDFDELAGLNSAATMASAQNPVVPETVGGIEHMEAPSVSLNEYELRMFSETFVEKIIYHLVKLEQAYETDPVVLTLAGQKAQLFERFGIDEITDELLNHDLTIRVNVGIGATNPATKLKNFLGAGMALGQMFGPSVAQGANFEEVAKEVFALVGYKDGKRFFQPGFDPRVQQLQQQIQELQKHNKGGPQPMDPHEVQFRQQEIQDAKDSDQRKALFDFGKLQMDKQDAEKKFQLETARLQSENYWKQMELHMQTYDRNAQIQGAADGVKSDMGKHLNALGEHIGALGAHLNHHAGTLHQRINQMGAAVQQHAQTMQAHGASLAESLKHVANHLNAPKRVKRDAEGNAIGIEHDHSGAASDLAGAIAGLKRERGIKRGAAGIEGVE